MYSNRYNFFKDESTSSLLYEHQNITACSLSSKHACPNQNPNYLDLDLQLPTFPNIPIDLGPPINLPGSTINTPVSTVISESNTSNLSINQPGIGLITGTIQALNPDLLPAATKPIGMLFSAATAGKKLKNRIQDSLDQGISPAEAYTCQTAKTITEELSGKLIKGAIVGGIPTYLAAAVASPPIAATLPIVLPLIPIAYQGADATSKVTGNTTEQACHSAFEYARQLSGGKP